jgi:hypothetical protein
VRGLAKPRPDRRGFSFPELTFPLIVLYAMTADDARARAKECKWRAETTDDPSAKQLQEFLAKQWLIIADQLDYLEKTSATDP